MSPHHSLDLGVEVAVREADHQSLESSKCYKLIVVIHFIAAFVATMTPRFCPERNIEHLTGDMD